MKRYICGALLLLLIVPLVRADVGIGIKWSMEHASAGDNSQKCVTYGLYNPFDTDVDGFLEATKELRPLFEAEEPKTVPAGTSSNDSMPTRICFNIPKIYKEDCLFLGMLCERKCEEPVKRYDGEVMASYKTISSGGRTGSATGSSFAVPLRLEAECQPYARDFTPVYVLVVLIAGIVAIFLLRRRLK